MKLHTPEVRTGLLVLLTFGIVAGVTLYLGAPGVFRPQDTFGIYFDNAAGLKLGAQVLLAGRKIGAVTEIHSPVPPEERPPGKPTYEVRVTLRVDRSAQVYKNATARLMSPSLLGEQVIDFSEGNPAGGVAHNGEYFVGLRVPSFSEAIPRMLEAIEPVATKATVTLEELQKTANHLSTLLQPEGQLNVAMSRFREFGDNLVKLSGKDSPIDEALQNVRKLSGDDGPLAVSLRNVKELTDENSALSKSLKSVEQLTSELANNKDINVTLANFRTSSEELKKTLSDLGPSIQDTGENLKDATDTLKREPWRLIWPSTKTYPGDAKVPVRKAVPANKKP